MFPYSSFKGEVAETSKKEKEKEQQLSDVYSINKKYTGPLKQALEDIENLKIKAEYYTKVTQFKTLLG
jgi:hypothetical protein